MAAEPLILEEKGYKDRYPIILDLSGLVILLGIGMLKMELSYVISKSLIPKLTDRDSLTLTPLDFTSSGSYNMLSNHIHRSADLL